MTDDAARICRGLSVTEAAALGTLLTTRSDDVGHLPRSSRDPVAAALATAADRGPTLGQQILARLASARAEAVARSHPERPLPRSSLPGDAELPEWVLEIVHHVRDRDVGSVDRRHSVELDLGEVVELGQLVYGSVEDAERLVGQIGAELVAAAVSHLDDRAAARVARDLGDPHGRAAMRARRAPTLTHSLAVGAATRRYGVLVKQGRPAAERLVRMGVFGLALGAGERYRAELKAVAASLPPRCAAALPLEIAFLERLQERAVERGRDGPQAEADSVLRWVLGRLQELATRGELSGPWTGQIVVEPNDCAPPGPVDS